MDDQQRKRIFQKVKSMTTQGFWKWMNSVHTRAYALAQKHYDEAMSIALQPKQAAAVKAKAQEIRESWDGIVTVTIEDTEAAELQDVGL